MLRTTYCTYLTRVIACYLPAVLIRIVYLHYLRPSRRHLARLQHLTTPSEFERRIADEL